MPVRESAEAIEGLAAPKRRGRPPVPADQRAEPTLPRSVRLTDAEWAELQARGVRGGAGSLAAWLARPNKSTR